MPANFSDTTPVAPAGRTNVAWQKSGTDISGNVPAAAPADAHYLTTQAEAGLSNETSLGALADNSLVAVDVAASVATVRAAVLADLLAAMGVQNANKALMGPATGADAAPTFRTFVQSDLPAQPFAIAPMVQGKPAAGLVLKIKIPFPCSFPTGLTGSTLSKGANPASTWVVSFGKGGSEFGTLSVATDGTPTWTCASGPSFNGTTDELSLTYPAVQDTTMTDVTIALKGTR